MKNVQLKITFLIALTFLSLLFVTAIFPINIIRARVHIENWDYEGRVPTESERLATIAVTDPYQLRYEIFLFDLDSNVKGTETIVVFYGLQIIPFAEHFYEEFHTRTETGGIYRFKLNETTGLKWVNITADNADQNSPNYDPKLAKHYKEIRDVLTINKHTEVFKNPNDPFNSELAYPIHFVSLVDKVGNLVTWEVERRDGNIIGGYFYTFGPTEPLFTEDKTNYTWPNYNVSVALATFRGAVPKEHSIKVGFEYMASLAAILLIASVATRKRLKLRRKLQ